MAQKVKEMEIEKIKKIPIQNSKEDSPYLQDESHLGRGVAEAVYFPAQ